MNKKKLTGFGAVLAAIASAILSLNRPHTPAPPAPVDPGVPLYTLVVHVCERDCARDVKLPGAAVEIVSQPIVITDGAGNAELPNVPAGRYRVCAMRDGYKAQCADHALPADGDVYLGLEPDVPPILPLHVDGRVFREASGAIWPWRGVTAFALLDRVRKGENIAPYLAQRRAAGANLVRVLTTMKNIVDLPPSAYTDAHLAALLAAAHAHGLRVELVALADAQDWPIEKQRAQVQRIIDAAAAAGAVDLVEVANEPFKNSADPVRIMQGVTRRAGVLMAYGIYGNSCQAPALPVLDYLTFHPDRKPEWPRTAKDARELRDGFGCSELGLPDFPGTHVPVVADEPMGADEIDTGSRSSVAEDFFWFAATAQLFSAGATFHSSAGIATTAPGPKTAAAERAFFAGMDAVPVAAQLGAYTRGLLDNCPLEHDDARALRTFCSLGPTSTCVVIRPRDGWRAVARAGWRIVSATGPRGTVMEMRR